MIVTISFFVIERTDVHAGRDARIAAIQLAFESCLNAFLSAVKPRQLISKDPVRHGLGVLENWYPVNVSRRLPALSGE